MIEIRCQSCRRLLGCRQADGTVEVKRGGERLATVESGVLWCGRCWKGQEVDARPSVSEYQFRVLEGGGDGD